MRMQVPSLGSLSGLRILCCCELRCRSQMRLGSGIAVAVVQASSYSSDVTPCLGTSICQGCGPKKTKIKKINILKSCIVITNALEILTAILAWGPGRTATHAFDVVMRICVQQVGHWVVSPRSHSQSYFDGIEDLHGNHPENTLRLNEVLSEDHDTIPNA